MTSLVYSKFINDVFRFLSGRQAAAQVKCCNSSLDTVTCLIDEQCGGAGSQDCQTAGVVSQGVRVIPEGLADSARARGSEYDPEGKGTLGGEG